MIHRQTYILGFGKDNVADDLKITLKIFLNLCLTLSSFI